jgi:hypothetical protein
LILLISLALVQTIQIIHAQNTATKNPWAINLWIANAQNGTSTTFAPFDQIQLCANVTYSNATQPDILVYFNVTGPSTSVNPTIITRIETTNSSGEAVFSFRLPIESDNQSSLVGTWQALATIQTTNGTMQQSLSFTTQWNMEITSINLENSQGTSQTVFSPGNTVQVQLTISSAGQPQTANVTLYMQNQQGDIINQTQILNSQIGTNSTSATQLQTDLQTPDGTTAGQMAINVAIYSGSYQNVSLPIAENQIAYFTLASNTVATTTPTTTPGPTSSPIVVQNSISLFSWLLIAVGLFTFTSLFMFLKRKPTPVPSTQTPIFAPSTPSTETTTPTPGQSAALQGTMQQPAQQTAAPTPKIAPEKVMEATVMSDINLNETTETQSKLIATEVGKPEAELESALAEETATQASLAHLSQISSAATRIQAMKASLKSKREQLAQDLAELNKLLVDRERTLKNYFGKVREEIEKAKTHLTDVEDTSDATTKPSLTRDLTIESTLQAILSYRSRIESTEKIIQALTSAIKIESEQLTHDLTEFKKQINEREKTLQNYYDILRQEIEWLENYLNNIED